jgi:alkylhydroperoxidase family enzyme
MAWIRTVMPDVDEAVRLAQEGQKKFYPKEYARAAGDTSESIVSSHTLIPDALYHAFSTFGVLMSPELPLSRAQHEMIATRVSALNRCVY